MTYYPKRVGMPGQQVGFYGAEPIDAPAAIADVPTGTAATAADNAAAINALLAALRDVGLIAS